MRKALKLICNDGDKSLGGSKASGNARWNSTTFLSLVFILHCLSPVTPLTPFPLSQFKHFHHNLCNTWNLTQTSEWRDTHRSVFCYFLSLVHYKCRHLLWDNEIAVHTCLQVALPLAFLRSRCNWRGTGYYNRSECRILKFGLNWRLRIIRYVSAHFSGVPSIDRLWSYGSCSCERHIAVNLEYCGRGVPATGDALQSALRETTSPSSCCFLFNDLTKSDKDAGTM